jgi:hypothetical protein
MRTSGDFLTHDFETATPGSLEFEALDEARRGLLLSRLGAAAAAVCAVGGGGGGV